MKRTLKMERLYNLGDFKNIKFGDEFIDINEEFMFDNEFVGNIKMLKLLGVESVYREYLKIKNEEIIL
ncbi:hypothetical protein LCGC14_2978290 [marine sediment metagenome]|uniref:Uncharacterized protein n=1 Tax=marine sediment metagenome TaxID=412755 RepID=A0A0F8XUU4_9ZZZZ